MLGMSTHCRMFCVRLDSLLVGAQTSAEQSHEEFLRASERVCSAHGGHIAMRLPLPLCCVALHLQAPFALHHSCGRKSTRIT